MAPVRSRAPRRASGTRSETVGSSGRAPRRCPAVGPPPTRQSAGRVTRETRSASVPATISVSGLRNRTQSASTTSSPRLFAAAKPRFCVATTRASVNSRATSSCVSSVEPLSTTTTTRSRSPRARRRLRGQARSQRASLYETTMTASCSRPPVTPTTMVVYHSDRPDGSPANHSRIRWGHVRDLRGRPGIRCSRGAQMSSTR